MALYQGSTLCGGEYYFVVQKNYEMSEKKCSELFNKVFNEVKESASSKKYSSFDIYKVFPRIQYFDLQGCCSQNVRRVL